MKKGMAKLLGSRLKAARQRAKVSQAHVAADLGVTRQSVSAWETGASTPTAIQLAQLSTAYCVCAHTLLFGEPFREVTMPEVMQRRNV